MRSLAARCIIAPRGRRVGACLQAGEARPGDSVHLVDLRQLNARQLSPLLDEESRVWREELHWDYRVSIELIKKFLESHSLAGFAAIEQNSATGYGFYVIE